jgi:hypothetical protein
MSANLRQNSGEVKCRPQVKLLEYDERFAVFKEFVRYDFEKAVQLPAELKGSFDAIVCDPPFLSQDCQTKGIDQTASLLESLLTKYSRSDRAMAGKVLDTRVMSPHSMHWRTYGEPDHRQAVLQDWNADHRLRDQAFKGVEQRVQMLCEL